MRVCRAAHRKIASVFLDVPLLLSTFEPPHSEVEKRN